MTDDRPTHPDDVDPIWLGVGNGVGAMPPDRGRLGDQILERLGDAIANRGGGVGVLLEADDCHPERALGAGFWWRHRQAKNLDGVLVFGTADRTAPGDADWLPGAPDSPVNDPRPILDVGVRVDGGWAAGGWQLDVCGLHRPKRGGERAAATMDQRLREARPDAFLTDGNLRKAAMAARFDHYAFRSEQVMHVAVRHGELSAGRRVAIDAVPGTRDDDHPLVLTRVRPTPAAVRRARR